jgi:hypothetical protein
MTTISETKPQDSPFVTTTDVMNSLNRIMAELSESGDKNDNGAADNGAAATRRTPAFELQRKLPDGTTRKASPSERKAADMDTKLKQVAEHVANLATEAERQAFGEQQRLYGNQLYIAQEYEQAIDVYLTCLTTVKPHTNGFLRIMNNLAQATLQLQWYSKAQQFCTLGLEQVVAPDNAVVDAAEANRLLIAKL